MARENLRLKIARYSGIAGIGLASLVVGGCTEAGNAFSRNMGELMVGTAIQESIKAEINPNAYPNQEDINEGATWCGVKNLDTGEIRKDIGRNSWSKLIDYSGDGPKGYYVSEVINGMQHRELWLEKTQNGKGYIAHLWEDYEKRGKNEEKKE